MLTSSICWGFQFCKDLAQIFISIGLGLPRWLSGKEPTCQCKRCRSDPWGEDSLEEGMATCSSIVAWRIPWTEEPGGLQFMGSQRVGHD